MYRTLIFAMLLGAAAPGTAAAREPEVLPKAGKWLANYDPDSCHLAAQFGTGDDAVFARFTRYEPGDHFRLTLFGKRLRSSSSATNADAKIDFGLGRAIRSNAMLGTLADRPAMFFGNMRLDGLKWSDDKEPPPITPEQEASVSGVTIDPSGPAFRLEFGSLGKPMKEMRNCLTDLVKSWGYDPEVEAGLSRRAMPTRPPAQWLGENDYPNAAARSGHNGAVQVRLDVDAAGTVTGCHVLARTSPDEFADATCRAIARRAKFEPALDAQQKPVRSFHVQSVLFTMG